MLRFSCGSLWRSSFDSWRQPNHRVRIVLLVRQYQLLHNPISFKTSESLSFFFKLWLPFVMPLLNYDDFDLVSISILFFCVSFMSLISLPSRWIGEDLESLLINFFFLWCWKSSPENIFPQVEDYWLNWGFDAYQVWKFVLFIVCSGTCRWVCVWNCDLICLGGRLRSVWRSAIWVL